MQHGCGRLRVHLPISCATPWLTPSLFPSLFMSTLCATCMQAVLVDTHRLWPLLAVVLAGAAFDTWNSGGAVTAAGSADVLLAAAGPALLKWCGVVGGLLAAALAAMRGLVGRRVFTGAAAGVDGSASAARAWPPPAVHLPTAQGRCTATVRTCTPLRLSAGTKWTAAHIDPSHPAAPATARFLHRTTQLLELPVDRLEPPTVGEALAGWRPHARC